MTAPVVLLAEEADVVALVAAPTPVVALIAVAQGVQGIQGISGGAGGEAVQQSTLSATWTINHALGRYPFAVTTTDNARNVIEGEVVYVSTSQVVITFGIPEMGWVYLS